MYLASAAIRQKSDTLCARIVLVIVMWRGHVENITSITLVEETKMLITSSLDCTVRIWTYDSEYVGKLFHYQLDQNCISSTLVHVRLNTDYE